MYESLIKEEKVLHMKKINKVDLLLIMVLIVVILPFVSTILYALPSTDDFWMAACADKENILQSAIDTANSFWMEWGGMWLYEFLRVFLNPLVRFGATSDLLGIELVIFFLLFLCALWVANSTVWKHVIKNEKSEYCLGCYLLLVIWFLNTEIWTEVFYWFVGTAYMWAMTFVLLTVALEIVYFKKPDMRKGICLSIIGAIACSFYSQAVFPCMIFLILAVFDYLEHKRIDLRKMVPFLFFVLGALSSLIAPGNFQRKEISGGVGVDLFGALKDTLIIWAGSLFDLVKNPLMIIMAVVFILLGMVALREWKYKYCYPFIPFVLTLICLYVSYFPFALGYGNSTYLPNRAKFAFDVFAVLLFSASFMYLGGWLREKRKVVCTAKELRYGLAGLAIFAYVCFIPTKYYEELPYAQTVAQMHQVKLANDEWSYLLNAIESSEEENIVYERSIIYTPIIKSPGITSDKEHSINCNIADFYGKESICVYWW